MNWLYTFKQYCEENGVHLLPDDMRYLEKMLKMIPVTDRRNIAHMYYGKWIKAFSLAPYPSMANNYARKHANSWLREVCERR